METKDEPRKTAQRADSFKWRSVPLDRGAEPEDLDSPQAAFERRVVEFEDSEFVVSPEGEPTSVSGPTEAKEGSGTAERPRRKRFIALSLLSALFMACLGAFWALFLDSYSAETKMLFVSQASPTTPGISWSMEQELEILKRSTLARDALYSPREPEDASTVRSVSTHHSVTPYSPDGIDSPSTGQTLDRLSFRVDRWNGGGCVTIGARGDSPAELRSLLENYTKQYVRSRRELVSLASISCGPTRPSIRFSGNPDFLAVLDGELARMELMKQNCELALTFIDDKMDKKRGFQSGFLPSGLGSELTSLNKINDELVNLCIKRQDLATRFNPASREMTELNQKIHGLRRMMRQHLRQQVSFLQTGMEQLQARRREIRGQSRPAYGRSEPKTRKDLCAEAPAVGGWIPVSPDVVIMPGRPIVVREPLRERITNFVGRALDFLLRDWNRPCPIELPTWTASRMACASAPFDMEAKGLITMRTSQSRTEQGTRNQALLP